MKGRDMIAALIIVIALMAATATATDWSLS
jgi:hypothetical protein